MAYRVLVVFLMLSLVGLTLSMVYNASSGAYCQETLTFMNDRSVHMCPRGTYIEYIQDIHGNTYVLCACHRESGELPQYSLPFTNDSDTSEDANTEDGTIAL